MLCSCYAWGKMLMSEFMRLSACLTPRVLQPFPLREISSRDFGLLTISYEILDKLFLSNPLFPRWHPYHHDDSTPPCMFEQLCFGLLVPWYPQFPLAALYIPSPLLSWFLEVRFFAPAPSNISVVATHGRPERLSSSPQVTEPCRPLGLSFLALGMVPHIWVQACFKLGNAELSSLA